MTLGLPVEYGVVEDRFHLGLGAGVEGFLDGPPTTLAENQQYQRVMATLPTEHNALMYLDLKQVIPLVQLLVAAAEGVEAIGSGFQASTDASPECGEYGTQEEAQEAYDEDAFEHFLLDQDGDGRACEDYFAPATPGAGTPEPDLAAGDYSAIEAFAAVSYKRDDLIGSNGILYIAE